MNASTSARTIKRRTTTTVSTTYLLIEDKSLVYLHFLCQDYIVYFIVQFPENDVKHIKENSNDVKKPKDESDYQFVFCHEFFLTEYVYNANRSS